MKCKVKDCENHTDQGVFVGFLCMPCYTFLNTGEGTYSQLYRNTVAEEREACAKVCEAFSVDRGMIRDETLKTGVFSGASMCALAIRERGAP
jgi:hypothetical protein